MKKNLKLLIVIVIVVGVVGFALNMYSNRDTVDTVMEERVNYAIDYTNENFDSLEITQAPQTLITEQNEMIAALETEYSNGEYTLDNPFIAVDPVDSNNLSAIVAFESDEPLTYSYTVQAKEDDGYPFTYSVDEEQSGTIVVPVVALYSDYKNTVDLTVTIGDQETTTSLEIQTTEADDKYVAGGSSVEELEKEAGLKLDEQTVLAMTDGSTNSDDSVTTTINDERIFDYADGFILSEGYDIYDFNGNLRFSAEKASDNSSIKFNDGRFLVLDSSNVLYEKDLFGRVYNYYIPPQSDQNGESYVFHHDFEIVGDTLYALSGAGSLEYLTANQDDFFRETMVLKIDLETAQIETAFDLSDYFRGEKQNISGGASAEDPIHLNSIDYYEDKNELILSSKSQSTIMAIDPDNGKLLWMIKDPAGVSEEMADYNLEVVNPDSMVYTSGNHSAFVMDTEEYPSSGNDLYISVFDNKHCVDDNENPIWTNIGETNTCTEEPISSSMIIYHVDLGAMTVETMEEIQPKDERWSSIRSSIFTNIPGIYSMNFAETSVAGKSYAVSNLYVTDVEGNLLTETTFVGLTNIYRSRLINEDELAIMLDMSVDTIFDEVE